ncbi:DUF7344 domain-containing protein [Natronococcus occultus]|uniref:DUF7344 domain-containing protein n=1 Tax=Natronococcus occultus SP4 TaxID=694430 RepID=L0K234_9EURY|nr:hypothetical protein [Natronococcus occultus]AGB39066.1 hypothetical protein Natoc_3331 [Natronococcus occultus SP4]
MDRTETFEVLASADRQLVLHELVRRNGTSSVEQLSQSVAARRHQLAPEDLDEQAIERARFRLTRTHLPKLAERDVIHLDWDEDAVALADGKNAARVFGLSEELECFPPDDALEHPSRSW